MSEILDEKETEAIIFKFQNFCKENALACLEADKKGPEVFAIMERVQKQMIENMYEAMVKTQGSDRVTSAFKENFSNELLRGLREKGHAQVVFLVQDILSGVAERLAKNRV